MASSSDIGNDESAPLHLTTTTLASSPQPGAPTPAAARVALTMGIELELVVAATCDDKYAPAPFDPRSVLLAPTVAQIEAFYDHFNGVEATATLGDVLTESLKVLFASNGVALCSPDGMEEGVDSGWAAKGDSSIRYPGSFDKDWNCVVPSDGEFFYYGIEIVSTILGADKDGFDEAKKVTDMLRTQLRASVNRSCGLHVHVGNGTKGFNLDTLINVAALLWVFDREIIRLHPKFRKSRRGTEYCRPLVANLLGRWPNRGDLKAKLLEIYTATTALELNCILGHHGRYVAYNFENIKSFVVGADKYRTFFETIEFRQHEATLRGDRVKNWAKFCVGLVEWAMRTSKEDMKQFLLLELGNQQVGTGMPIWEIASWIYLDDVAVGFKAFVEEKERLQAAKKAMKEAEHKIHLAEEAVATKNLREGEYDDDYEDALDDHYCKKMAYEKLSDEHYTNGGTAPDKIMEYDSDGESEYGEEVAYYGKPGIKPENADATADVGYHGNALTRDPQFCARCRPAAFEDVGDWDQGSEQGAEDGSEAIAVDYSHFDPQEQSSSIAYNDDGTDWEW